MEKKKEIQFHLGDFGAVLPFLTMLSILILLVITGNKSAQNYWTGAFMGIVVAYFLIKDKKEFNSLVMNAIKDPMFGPLFLTFIFSGIFSKSLSIGGLANGILWMAQKIGLGPAFFPLAMFLIGCLLSTAMGTSGGTITAMIPIFLPTGAALGCNPYVVVGAIMSGAYFGDNLAPISDTTIASAGTQGIDVGSCVRTRIKFSIASAILTSIVLIWFGISMQTEPLIIDSMVETNPSSLILIIAPALLVFLVVKGFDLIPCLLISTIVSMALSLAFGLITLDRIYATDGIVAAGTTGMIGIAMFTMFTFVLIKCITDSGVLDRMILKVSSFCKTPRSTELALIAICAIIVFMVPSNSTAIVLAGPVAAKMIKAQGMEKTRGSNILDGICVAVSGLIPYGGGVLIAQSLAVSSGVFSESLSPTEITPFNIYNMCLIVIFIFAAITGWGRKFVDRTHDSDLSQITEEA